MTLLRVLLLMCAVVRSTAPASRWACPCESWGCQPACPCACPCPCADASLCAPLNGTTSAGRREVLAFHAHLYNESARSGPQNFDHFPWDKLTAVAIYTGVGNDTNGTDSVSIDY